jgi:hypothetical protein
MGEEINAEQGEAPEIVTLRFQQWRPGNIDKTFIKMHIVQSTGMVEFLWTEERFGQLLRQLNETGSAEEYCAVLPQTYEFPVGDDEGEAVNDREN